MTDLATRIAQACLDEIQARPDTPKVDELAEVVKPLLLLDLPDLRELYRISERDLGRERAKQVVKQVSPKRFRHSSKCPHSDCHGILFVNQDTRLMCIVCGRYPTPKENGDG